MLQDADKMSEQPANKTIQVGFVCPQGFEPAAFFVVAMDKEGRDFINTTNQPNVALRLATIAIDFASKQAIHHMQREQQERSRIVVAPAGSVPSFPGPAGRG